MQVFSSEMIFHFHECFFLEDDLLICKNQQNTTTQEYNADNCALKNKQILAFYQIGQ